MTWLIWYDICLFSENMSFLKEAVLLAGSEQWDWRGSASLIAPWLQQIWYTGPRRTMCVNRCYCPVKFSKVPTILQELAAKEPRRKQQPAGPAAVCDSGYITFQSINWLCCKAQPDCAAKHRLNVLQSTDWMCCAAKHNLIVLRSTTWLRCKAQTEGEALVTLFMRPLCSRACSRPKVLMLT